MRSGTKLLGMGLNLHCSVSRRNSPTSVWGSIAPAAASAAALLQSMATNHAVADGNKRTAWAATRMFYGLNDYRIAATEDERFEVIIAVATRELDTVNKIAARLAQIAVGH